jgi:hypothetical protein
MLDEITVLMRAEPAVPPMGTTEVSTEFCTAKLFACTVWSSQDVVARLICCKLPKM